MLTFNFYNGDIENIIDHFFISSNKTLQNLHDFKIYSLNFNILFKITNGFYHQTHENLLKRFIKNKENFNKTNRFYKICVSSVCFFVILG